MPAQTFRVKKKHCIVMRSAAVSEKLNTMEASEIDELWGTSSG
jgi:hypothetical protein